MEKKVIEAESSGQFFKYVNRILGRLNEIGILKDQ